MTDGEEKEVGDDDEQRGHAHDELYQQVVCLREVSFDDALCGGDGGSCHHGEQRHRQDGSRHFFRNVCFVHKYLWSCKLYQAIESLLKSAAKVQIKVKTQAVFILKNRKSDLVQRS